ncbi:hypothetical protein H310_05504 [Aphanomyces invadans]|uniref:Uncharacterized protein n=1 Tax=Aphanomyces invadans TaxID=157072 RepID=A0A024U9H3_9STRA|nr:hypothetical protein H310_05504 [Aphanomyces invadans]ETW03076.1 hypothetical protein H310_05504 [Aphanomyces invadans]RHY34406.1 hypothetical protein DYB32_000962 [Aphanomyces invadans]|eukprot:XP_008868460.1 hypothetical protein H310_05504 [Aphanomyces invadans]
MGHCCSKRRPEIDDGDVIKPAAAKGLATIEVASPAVPSSFHQVQSTTTAPRKADMTVGTALRRETFEEGNNDTIMPLSGGSPSRDDLYGSSITSSKYIYTSPPSSPSKSSEEPQVEDLQDLSQQYQTQQQQQERQQQQQQHAVYIPPEDRPIESMFIREERIRLAQIQEQLRLERQAANDKWVAELREKKKEFLPDVVVYREFSPRVD